MVAVVALVVRRQGFESDGRQVLDGGNAIEHYRLVAGQRLQKIAHRHVAVEPPDFHAADLQDDPRRL